MLSGMARTVIRNSPSSLCSSRFGHVQWLRGKASDMKLQLLPENEVHLTTQ